LPGLKAYLFVEPASAGELAALQQGIRSGAIDPAGTQVAVTLIGHGLKDPATAMKDAKAPIQPAPDNEAFRSYLVN
jgi:threonine synthase